MKETRFSRLLALALIPCITLLGYLGVLYDTQVTHHADYLLRSHHSIAREETITASRGVITDRMGRLLVSNNSIYNLTFDASLLKEGQDQNEAIARLLELCQKQGKTWEDNLPVSAQKPYVYTLDRLSDIQRLRFLAYLKSLDKAAEALGAYLLEHPYLAVSGGEDAETAPEAGTELPLSPQAQGAALLEQLPLSNFTSRLLLNAGLAPLDLLEAMVREMEIPARFSQTQARQVLGVRYELALRKLNNYTDYILVEDVDTAFISMINDGGYAGAKITSSSARQYETPYAAHILGTVGLIYGSEELERLGEGYDLDDWVGKSGVEAAFEEYLKGSDGRRVVSTNSTGHVTGEYYEVQPKPGNTVELTIDLELQQAVENALAKTVAAMNEEDGLTTRGAGAAVVKVGSGEVLSVASHPTYDLSTYHQNIAKLDQDPAKPMFNRATQGTYAPGSTFKPLVAVAALEEEAVTLTERILATGRWYYPDIIEGSTRWHYNCWNQGGHGRIGVSRAITVSCNYFFYEMGYRLGINRLNEYSRAFGLGEHTGIEIGDNAGTLAGPEYSASVGATWYGGNTVMAAIGQSDNLFTPLQLANYVATLVSGGEHYATHLLKAVKTYDNAEVVATGASQPLNTVPISDSTLEAVKKGMHDLTTSTLSSYFSQCVVSAGAKTGTAQLGGDVEDNGVFICFAPYEEPEIAVGIVIEKGGSGAALASTAVEILNAYFSPKDVGAVVLPENQLLP